MSQKDKVGAALIVGGGIAGMQAALDLVSAGIKVYLVERKPGIGGVMSQLDKTFPTNDCAMCTMAPRLVDVGRNPHIEVITNASVKSLKGQAGSFTATVEKKARFVDEDKCTGCGSCVQACPVMCFVYPPEEIKMRPEDLNPEYREEVVKIIEKHKGRPGPLMPILQEINEYLFYFPEDVLAFVAQETGYSLSHVYRVATFYSAFSIKPRGKFIIQVCMGTTCYVKGAEMILNRFSEVLEIEEGETTPDRLFTLKSVRCIGCCGLAPAVLIGDRVFGKVSVREVEKIVKIYRDKKAA